MNQEIEAKFLQVSHDDIRVKLNSIGATISHPLTLMKRVMFDYPDKRLRSDNWARVRVRDEGDVVTLSYKRGGEAEYSDEIETTVGSYDDTCKLLEAIGLRQYAFQESKRETWRLGEVEVMLDQWPWLSPYLEIEGPSEIAIKQVARQLMLEWSEAKFGNVDTAYRVEYPRMTKDESIGAVPELRFSGEKPDWLEERA